MTGEGPGWTPPAGSPPGTIDTSGLDVVYIVRPGDNEELRYSLRSVAAHLPHREVWIAGHCPSWVTNVRRLDIEPLPDKFANQRQSLTAAVSQDGLTSRFVLMNDDMYVLRWLNRLPVVHLGPLSGLTAHVDADEDNGWQLGLVATERQMHRWGYDEPLAYEAHTPLPFDKARLAWVLADADTGGLPFLWGCAYDACGAVVGEAGQDVKVSSIRRKPLADLLETDSPFLSTNDGSFFLGPVGDFVRRQFPDPCRYEEAS